MSSVEFTIGGVNYEPQDDAMSVDQLIAELQAAKAGGHITGNEPIVFGSNFLAKPIAARSVSVVTDGSDGKPLVGISTETEAQWLDHHEAFGLDIDVYDANEPTRPKRSPSPKM